MANSSSDEDYVPTQEPFAEWARPKHLDDIVGQRHLLDQNTAFRNMLDAGALTSCLFAGPPGTGKTTMALIIASMFDCHALRFNATNASVKDIQTSVAKANDDNDEPKPVLLYIDEIQYFNKRQQQTLLPIVESGDAILIAATTDDPAHALIPALRSRLTTFKFEPVTPSELMPRLEKLAKHLGFDVDADVLVVVAERAGGDVRFALNQMVRLFDLCTPCGRHISRETPGVMAFIESSTGMPFDLNADVHYQLVSALQKSIRGGDASAAAFYLTRMLDSGDMVSACRRMAVCAYEDIGLADEAAVLYTHAAIADAERVGLPEAKHMLVSAAIRLALAPKSNAAGAAYGNAKEILDSGQGVTVPSHIASDCAPGYVYPHNYPLHYVAQQYMPDDVDEQQFSEIYRPASAAEAELVRDQNERHALSLDILAKEDSHV